MWQKKTEKLYRAPGVQVCSPASLSLLKNLLAYQWKIYFPLLVQEYQLVYLDLVAHIKGGNEDLDIS